MKNSILSGLASLILVTAAPASPAASRIRVMILDGQSGGPYHSSLLSFLTGGSRPQWQLITTVLKKELEETGLFQVDVLTAPQSGGDFSNFRPEFTKYQVVVSNYDGPDWPANLKSSFEQYIKDGGGLVIVHSADNAFPGWVAYNEMIGIGGWRGRDEKSGPLWYFKENRLVSDTSPGNAGAHGAELPYQLAIRDMEHPITRGLPRVWMHAADELYGSLRGPGKNMTVLATAHADPANRGTGRDEPALMALSYGKGRIFHTIMGHDVAAMSCVGFIASLQRGTEWAATGKVTQKVPAGFPTAETVSSRPDITALDPALKNGPATLPASLKRF